eukprot:2265325-Amphidinium_carterae.1
MSRRISLTTFSQPMKFHINVKEDTTTINIIKVMPLWRSIRSTVSKPKAKGNARTKDNSKDLHFH